MQTSTQAPATAGIDTWAIVELFGHKKVAGKLSEYVLGAAALIRCDVPETETDERKTPAFTRYLGVGSIYGITPCSEEVARAAAARIMRWDPPIPLEFQQPQLPARSSAADAEIVDDEDDEDLGTSHGEPSDQELERELAGGESRG